MFTFMKTKDLNNRSTMICLLLHGPFKAFQRAQVLTIYANVWSNVALFKSSNHGSDLYEYLQCFECLDWPLVTLLRCCPKNVLPVE